MSFRVKEAGKGLSIGKATAAEVDRLNRMSADCKNSDINLSFRIAQKASRLAKKSGYKEGLAFAYRNAALCKSTQADYNSAISYLKKSLKIFLYLHHLKGTASSYNVIGILNRKKGNYVEAIEYYKKSLDINKRIKDRKSEAGVLNNLGFAYTNIGDYQNALVNHSEASRIFSDLNDRAGEASCLTNIALIYKELEDYEEDLKYEKKSLEIKEEIGDKKGQSNSLINIGNTYAKLEDFEKATGYYKEGLKLKIETGDKAGEINALLSLANVYLETGKLSDAGDLLKRCLKEYVAIGDKSGEVYSLITLSDLSFKRKRTDESLKHLNKAMKISKEYEFKDLIFEINRKFSVVYKKKKDFTKALKHFELYHGQKDEVINERTLNRVKNLQVLHKVETTEKEAQMQKLKNVELRHALTELTSALDISDIISRTDTKGNITYVNEKFCEISGYDYDELIGKSHNIVNSGYHPKKVFKEMWAALRQGKVWKGELKNKTKTGETYWVDSTIVPLFDEKKNPLEYLAITNDITERKVAEEKLIEQYYELEKTNSELDKFVYSTSHDLRSPLTSILGILDIALEESKDETGVGYLKMIKGSINKLDNIVKDIIDYSKNARQEIEYSPVNLFELSGKTLSELNHISGFGDIKINFDFNKNSLITTDPYRLTIILKNLLSNAIRYHDAGKEKKTVNVKFKDNSANYYISVEDNGVGMESNIHDKIFGQFFKANLKSEGSGLGLYIAKMATKKLGGELSVTSKPREGSEFTLKIPKNSKIIPLLSENKKPRLY